jgi:hypothetical protein
MATITRVDSFIFNPRSKSYVRAQRQSDPAKTPWTRMEKTLSDCTVALVSSAGIFMKGDIPFDYERERRQPTWGDPTHREIPRTAGQDDVEYSHLHIDTSFMYKDRNVSWPVDIFDDYEKEGRVGHLANTMYSIMGYIPNFNPLLKKTAPKMIAKMKEERVDAVFFFPV